MAAKYTLGQLLTVKINDLPYLGTVLTFDENADPVTYVLSVAGRGDTICVTEDDLDEENEDNG